MQLTHFFTLLAASYATLTSALTVQQQVDITYGANAIKCGDLGYGAWRAIVLFCSNPSIDTGSSFAHTGKIGDGVKGSTRAFIRGSCPADQTWVPQEWCFKQFFETCAMSSATKEGWGYKKFGYKNCQEFNLMPGACTADNCLG